MKSHLRMLGAAAICFALLTPYSFAESPGDPDFKKVKLLKKRLELTDEQADSMYSILRKHNYSECSSIDSFTRKSECFKKARSAKNVKMKSILSDSQKAELDLYVAECKAGHSPAPKKESSAKVSCSG